MNRKQKKDAFDEIELLGFPLSDPFELLATSDYGNTMAKELINKRGKRDTLSMVKVYTFLLNGIQ